jgi:hypothetical protein
MTSSPGRSTTVIGLYYLAVGVALIVAGWRTSSWWSGTLGLAMLTAAVATVFGGGEWTTWFRGELDERRKHASDHGFKVAFFVLAWWIGAVSIYASGHTVGIGLWAAGNAVALTAAIADYAFVLRRT